MLRQDYIYDLDNFFEVWEQLMQDTRRRKEQGGGCFFEDYYNSAKAVSLLMFHGLTAQQVCEIKLTDVSEQGIAGYDIKFDPRVIEFFVQYKNQEGFTRVRNASDYGSFARYTQNTFIRSERNEAINEIGIANFVSPRNFADAPLVTLFKMRNIRRSWMFRTVYEYAEKNQLNLRNKFKSSDMPHVIAIAKILEVDNTMDSVRKALNRLYLAKFEQQYREYLESKQSQQTEQKSYPLPEVAEELGLTYDAIQQVYSENQQLAAELKRNSVNCDSANREILKRKLLDRITYVEMELTELKKLVSEIL